MPLFSRRQSNVSNQFTRRDNSNSMIPRWSRPPERNTAEWIKTFSTSPRLAVVDRIASDLSFATGKLYAIASNGEEQEVQSHPFLDFWDNLNPLHEYSSAALWQLHEIYLLLKGEGYFIIERDPMGRPSELWPVPTHWVFMTPYLGHPFYRVRTSSGGIIDVPVEDMFVMKSLNPFDPFMRGLGAAESISDEVETDEYASKFQKRFFFNDATPNLIVAMPKSTDEQRKRFRMEWLERFQGVFKSHGMATVNGEVSVQRVGETMKDMDMVNGRMYLRDAVLEHFGVPREIMGITENSNRATAEAAQFIYAQNVLMPRLRRREEAVNKQLLPMFGENLVWRYDDIVPRNQEFDKMKGIDGWNAGLLLKDEARELLDLAPATTGGRVYKGTFSDVFIGEDEDPVAVTAAMTTSQMDMEPADAEDTVVIEDAPDKGGDIEVEDGTDEDIVEILDAYGQKAAGRRISLSAAEQSENAALREMGAAFEIATMKFFREQAKRIGAALGETEKADGTVWDNMRPYFNEDGTVNYEAWNLLDEAQQKALADKFVSGMIDWTREADILNKIYEPLWRKAYDAGAKHSQDLYRVHSVQRPELVSTAKLRGGKRVVGIQDATKESISRIVSDGITHGNSTKAMAQEIMQEMQTTSSRAKLIARQETTTSLTTGQYDMMRTAGATTKTWHHRPQKQPRDGKNNTPNHVALNGETRAIDERFSNGLRFPRDPECSDPAEVINCHCYVTYGGF